MSRESSAGEPKVGEEMEYHIYLYFDNHLQTIYSLKDLQVGNSVRLPRDVNRTKLEVGG